MEYVPPPVGSELVPKQNRPWGPYCPLGPRPDLTKQQGRPMSGPIWRAESESRSGDPRGSLLPSLRGEACLTQKVEEGARARAAQDRGWFWTLGFSGAGRAGRGDSVRVTPGTILSEGS